MLHARLAGRVPTECDATIVHSDYRIDNTILAPDRTDELRAIAIVDWELSPWAIRWRTWGLTLVYRDPAFAPVLAGSAASPSDRFPEPDALAEFYARASGRDLGNLDFYLGLGYFKIAVIAEGIHARFLAGETVGVGFESVCAAVPELAAAGLRTLGPPCSL